MYFLFFYIFDWMCLIFIQRHVDRLFVKTHLSAVITNHLLQLQRWNNKTEKPLEKWNIHSTHSGAHTHTHMQVSCLATPEHLNPSKMNLFIHYWLCRERQPPSSRPTSACRDTWTIRWRGETLAHRTHTFTFWASHTHFHLLKVLTLTFSVLFLNFKIR